MSMFAELYTYMHILLPSIDREMVISLVLVLLLLLVLIRFTFGRCRSVSESGATTPPGAVWRIPVIGDTLHFLRDPHDFYVTNISRYGSIFSTSLFGERCIVVTTPDATKWVLQTAQRMFKPAYPESAKSLIDPTKSFSSEHHHAYARRAVMSCLYPEHLQLHFTAIESMALSILNAWDGKKRVNVYNQMAKYTFEVTMKILCGMEPGSEMDSLFQNMQDFEKAFLSIHINLPFTDYRRGLKARDTMFRAIEKMIRERRKEDLVWQRGDMLGSILGSDDHNLTDTHVRGIIMTILFAGHETSAAQLVWAIKHLHDNPKLLQNLKDEHEHILKKREPGSPLTWSQVKEMQLTLRVINETMRTSYIGLFLPREPLEDMEYDGCYFPKGWKVYASPSMLHLNPNLFPDPYRFDPSRFQGCGPKPNTFIPFGSGNRLCLGSELAKVEMLILIHHLVTKYSWKIQGSEYGIRWWPVPIPKDGLVIQVETLHSQTGDNN